MTPEVARQFCEQNGETENLDINQNIEIKYDNYEYSHPGDEAVFCLEKCEAETYTNAANVDELYVVAGAYQGKIRKDGETFEWCTPLKVDGETEFTSQSIRTLMWDIPVEVIS